MGANRAGDFACPEPPSCSQGWQRRASRRPGASQGAASAPRDVDRARHDHGEGGEREQVLRRHGELGAARVRHRVGRREGDRARQRDVQVVVERRLPVVRGRALLVVLVLREDEVGVAPGVAAARASGPPPSSSQYSSANTATLTSQSARPVNSSAGRLPATSPTNTPRTSSTRLTALAATSTAMNRKREDAQQLARLVPALVHRQRRHEQHGGGQREQPEGVDAQAARDPGLPRDDHDRGGEDRPPGLRP